MNRRKKLLCVFLLAAFLFCYTSVNVFAEGVTSPQQGTTVADGAAGQGTNGGNADTENNKNNNQNNNQNQAKNPDGNAANETKTNEEQVQAKVSSTASEAPSSKAASSKAPASSKKKKKKYYTVSSSASSAPESRLFDGFGVSSEIVSSNVISLPEAGVVSENDPLASASNGDNSQRMKQIGILAWVCIALGVLVVLIVILSNRRPPRGPGRSRYHRPKRGGRKHLLNDKYYRGLNRY